MKWILLVMWITADGDHRQMQYETLYDTKESCKLSGLVVARLMSGTKEFNIVCKETDTRTYE